MKRFLKLSITNMKKPKVKNTTNMRKRYFIVFEVKLKFEVDYIDGEAEGQYMDAGYMEDEVEGEEYHDHDDAAQQQ